MAQSWPLIIIKYSMGPSVYYEDFIEIILNKVIGIEKTALFNKLGILNRVKEIRYANNKAESTLSFQTFIIEMLAILDLLLTVDLPLFQNSRKETAAKPNSVKAIANILNSGKLVSLTGMLIIVDVDKYLKIEAFKKNKDIPLLRQLENLKRNFETVLTCLSRQHDPLDRAIALCFSDRLETLKKEKNRVIETLDAAAKIIKKFDKDIKKLYQCTASLVFSELIVCMFAPEPDVPGVMDLQNQIKTKFPRKQAVFLLGDYPDAESISKQMMVIYLSALTQLKEFTLTLDNKENTQLSPEVFSQKQKIMEAFNSQFQKLFKALKPLANEVTHKNYTKAPLTFKYADDLPVPDSEKKEEKASPVLILSRDITDDELPACETLQLTLKKDEEYLLVEAELAYKIVEIYNYMLKMKKVFAHTPRHLFLLPSVVLKSDIENYLKELEDSATKVKIDFLNFIESLQDDIHRFADCRVLMAIPLRLDHQIMPALQAISNDISAENIVVEALFELRQKLTAIDANIHDLRKMLEGHINFHLADDFLMKKLTITHKSLTDRLEHMRLTLSALNQEYEKLKPEFKDRKKQSLIEIETLIQHAQRWLHSLEKKLSEFSTPLSFNLRGKLMSAFEDFSEVAQNFDRCVAEAISGIVTQNNLLSNAGITKHVVRFGEHPNRMQLSGSQTPVSRQGPLPTQDEKSLSL
jgi:hypothetical protein